MSEQTRETLEQAMARLNKLPPIQAKPMAPASDVAAILADAKLSERHSIRIPRADTKWQKVCDMFAGKIGSGFIAVFSGIQGRGKTQLGHELIYLAADKKRTGRFSTATDFFMDLKATYRKESAADERSIVLAYVKPHLLVLDECDKRTESAWENNLLFHMVNKRYNALKDTVLIVNQSTQEFVASAGQSIVSRIQETGGIIDCTWESFRK